MKKIIFNFFLVGLATSSSAIADQSAPSPSSEYGLSVEEVDRLSALGIKGDRKAIGDLVAFYLIHEQNHETGMQWLERLGELGDEDARDSVIGYYEAKKSSPEASRYAAELRKRWGHKKSE